MKIFDILKAIGILIIFFFLPKIIIKNITSFKNNRRKTIIYLTINIIRYISLVIFIFFIIGLFNIKRETLLATTSFLGLILGIGAQKLFQDMISGFFIIFEDHIRVDDYVLINDSMGEVVNIGLKTTTIKTWEGEYHAISNGDIVKIVNYSKYPSLAIVDINISYDNDLDKVRRVIDDFIDCEYKDKNIIGKIEFLGFQETSNMGIMIRIVANTISYEHFGVRRYITEEVIKRLINNNIKMPELKIV